MDKKKFGSFIKESRIKKGLTQKELADLLYIDVTGISKWERGITYPDITLIPDICKYLEINEHELIESSNDTEYRKLKADAKKYNKIKNVIFWFLSIGYLIAILTCFVCNLAINHTLSWFFIVFSSCLAGFTFCPSILRFVEKKKTLFFALSTFASLFVLYLTISIYTKNYWCFSATIGTLILYFAIFYPFFFYNQKNYLKEKTFSILKRFFILTYGAILCVLTVFLLIMVNVYVPINIATAIKITLFSFILLGIYGIVQLFYLNKWISIGISMILTALYSVALCFFLCNILGGNAKEYFEYNFYDFSNHTNANVSLIIFVSLVLFGIVSIIIGATRKRK